MKEQGNKLLTFFVFLILMLTIIIFVQFIYHNAYIRGIYSEIIGGMHSQISEDNYYDGDSYGENGSFEEDYSHINENKMNISIFDDFDTNIKISDNLLAFLNDFGNRNGIIKINISGKTQEFLKNNEKFLFNQNSEIPEDIMEEDLYYNMIEKNSKKYEDKFFRIRSEIITQVKIMQLST